MHIERLRQIKPAFTVVPPKKPTHVAHNLKKELKNLGKFALLNKRLNTERMTEIQYENRVLLRKMLKIDL